MKIICAQWKNTQNIIPLKYLVKFLTFVEQAEAKKKKPERRKNELHV